MNPSIEGDHPFIPFAHPSIGEEEKEAVIEVLESGWLTTASKTAEFERRFAAHVGAEHAIAVNSGTSGLHLALEAFGISPGQNVATTTYTFTATAETIRYLGAHPVFVDIAEDSFNLDIDEVAHVARTKNLHALLPVHIAGEPCRMDALREIADVHGIPIIEDAAHAFPGRTPWGFAGTAGEAGVYSFYANKTITTGEGGMVVTRDESAAARIRTMRLHGIDRSIWDRYTTDRARAWEYDVVAPGFKYNMPDTAAAIGLAQLAKADQFLARRREIAARYNAAFAERTYLSLPRDVPGHTWHLYILALDLDALTIDRDTFAARLHQLGIGTSVHYKPLHFMTYYRSLYGLTPKQFPRASARYQRVLSLPIYPDLGPEVAQRVVEAVLHVGDGAYRGR